jgi:Flp pilus assembly protein TadD/peroxiredoxin
MSLSTVRPHIRALLTAVAVSIVVVRLGATDPEEKGGVYRPELVVPETIRPFLEHVEPGSDAFPIERQAQDVESRLRELSDVLRARPVRIEALAGRLFAPQFRGGPLAGGDIPAAGSDPFTIVRSAPPAAPPSLDARAFSRELARLVADRRVVTAAELLVTWIDALPAGELRTTVRYDIVGAGETAWRVQRVGQWQIRWQTTDSGWRATEWSSSSNTTSVARRPVFTEVTGAALGGTESFQQQLRFGLDSWMRRIDGVLTRDSNGHHGVSVGDADGDGLEDLYVAQPAGLPNRLYRARGDSTFEDVTDRAGLGVLDDTAQSLFADVDNDGDEDLVLATGTKPLLFANDGTGRFAPVPDAFTFATPLQGALTSMAMADFDRDGFLDLYLCVYSYFYGAGEDKAGTPAPYYDARNGPPAVLFRNDGRGRFVDVTRETGIGEGNDRYHFAAAWGDYDGDGWPDLLVANDFGTKNLYRNRGKENGRVTFEEVAATAGVLDHGAGMSATFFDYDNDGQLDIYTGNMWAASGMRVTASPAFMPDASPDVRTLYQRHARGNSLFRNLGDGRFEEKTLDARVGMGRWSWSSDALDFDSDGWEDLYVVNGMLTRDGPSRDLEDFFWRQVVARSPLTRVKGTPYDDGWRAINYLLMHDSIAAHQRNVFLRNDGHGRFDDVSGSVGLDLDQDGRSFAVVDVDRDGDSDVVVMAARQAPQLRVFRNDFAPRGTTLAIRLRGTASNRDAVGARVTVETDRIRRTKVVQAGSGFLSQHSKELLFGLGPSQRIVKVTIAWPSGRTQQVAGIEPNTRVLVVEGGEVQRASYIAQASGTSESVGGRGFSPAAPPAGGRDVSLAESTASARNPGNTATWLYEPFPAPDFSAPDLSGRSRSLGALRGHPAVLLFWSPTSDRSRAAVDALAAGVEALSQAGIGAVAIALDPPEDRASLRSTDRIPIVAASREIGTSYAIVHRYTFMNRPAMPLPTAFLLDGSGDIVRVYHGGVDVDLVARDAGAIAAAPGDRLARALPFRGTFYTAPPRRNYVPYGRELLDQGFEAAALTAFERASQASPNAFTLYRLGSLLASRGDDGRARAAFERALAMQPDLAEAHNDLGAMLAREGDLGGAIARFRAAIAATPEYPDALNNLGYALLLSGHDGEARAMYEKALALQPDFPEALNNLGMLEGRSGELDAAERSFRDALKRRADYGEAANNLALVLVARGDPDESVKMLEEFLQRNPEYEGTYITLAKIYLSTDRRQQGLAMLERLLQRNPTHAQAREIYQQFK